MPITEFVKNLVVEQLPEAQTENPTLALFQQWKTEDVTMNAEEIETEKRLWQEFEQGINESRKASGMREL